MMVVMKQEFEGTGRGHRGVGGLIGDDLAQALGRIGRGMHSGTVLDVVIKHGGTSLGVPPTISDLVLIPPRLACLTPNPSFLPTHPSLFVTSHQEDRLAGPVVMWVRQ